MIPTDPWLLVGWLAYGGVATLATRQLAAQRRRSAWSRRWSVTSLTADLVWIALVWLGGVVAARYIERIRAEPFAALAFVLCAAAAFVVSLARAILYQRTREGPRRKGVGRLYALFVVFAFLVVAAAIFPIAASDLFRRPYSRVWDFVDRTMARFNYTPNPYGGGEPPTFPPWQNPGDAGLAYRDVVLTTQDGLKLTAWYVPAEETGSASIILAHGLQDSKWTLLRLVPWLHEAGYNVLLFDFRGHGASDKRPTTIGREEALDVEAALDWLESEGVGDRVAGLGMSLGAAALVNAAAQDDRLDALILDSLFAEWKNVDYARGYRLPPEWLVPDVPDPVEVERRIHVPLFFIHGTADILTRVDHAYRLLEAANEPKSLWVNDSGHAWSAWTYPNDYRSKVLGFLDSALLASADGRRSAYQGRY